MTERDLTKALREATQEAVFKEAGVQVAMLRRAKGWTREELGRRAGVNFKLIERIEGQGVERSTITTLNKIAHALDVALTIRLEAWSRLIDLPVGFEHDERLHQIAAPPQPVPDGEEANHE